MPQHETPQEGRDRLLSRRPLDGATLRLGEREENALRLTVSRALLRPPSADPPTDSLLCHVSSRMFQATYNKTEGKPQEKGAGSAKGGSNAPG